MDEKDRKLILKIAKRLDGIESLLNTKEDKKLENPPTIATTPPTPLPVAPPAVNKPGEPMLMIVSKFGIKSPETLANQNVAHDGLRKMITQFCNQHGIEELNIHFKENKKI